MNQKEIRKLTKEKLINIKVTSAQLNKYKRKLEEAQKLDRNKIYINELKLKVLEYETELINIKNAIESLEDREKKIVTLTLFEKASLNSVGIDLSLSPSQVYRIKSRAIDTIGKVLFC